jgi:threonine/homoserine efflux transporter RhtA
VAGAETASLPLAGRAPGIALALASMTTIQLGAALSEPLFDRVGPAGTVTLRLALAAVILLPLARRACAGDHARTSVPRSRSAPAPAC